MMPHRGMSWDGMLDTTHRYDQGPATFRQAAPAVDWVGPDTTTGDPRLTPDGDVARRGTIPPYVPYAVLSPGVLTSVPQ